jgi:hypothetical protein
MIDPLFRVDHCTTFDKDPWTPVGCDGNPICSALANSAGTSTDEATTYDAMASVPVNYHLARWRCTLSETGETCVICHNLARGDLHLTKKCPILKKLGLKLEKRSAGDNSNDSASQVASDTQATAPNPVLCPTLAPDTGGGLPIVPCACTALLEDEPYNSGDNFYYKGQYEGVLYNPSRNGNNVTSLSLSATPACLHTSQDIDPPNRLQTSHSDNTSHHLVHTQCQMDPVGLVSKQCAFKSMLWHYLPTLPHTLLHPPPIGIIHV